MANLMDLDTFSKDMIKKIPSGTTLKKPRSLSRVRWSRGNGRFFHGIGKAGNEKGFPVSVPYAAYVQLMNVGEVTWTWFTQSMPRRAEQAPCDFSAIGAI